MSSELFQTIEAVAREKNIDVDVIIDAMQDAIVAASKKYYKTRENLVSRFNRDTGELEVYAQKTVVEAVEADPGRFRPTHLLSVELSRLEADYAGGGLPVARVEMTAALARHTERRVLATWTVRAEQPAAAGPAPSPSLRSSTPRSSTGEASISSASIMLATRCRAAITIACSQSCNAAKRAANWS